MTDPHPHQPDAPDDTGAGSATPASSARPTTPAASTTPIGSGNEGSGNEGSADATAAEDPETQATTDDRAGAATTPMAAPKWATTPAAPTEPAAAEPTAARTITEAGPTATPFMPAAGRERPKGVLLGVGAGVLVIVALGLAAFVWPGLLAGPGKPDEVAAAASTALSGKNSAELDKVLCKGPDGKAVGELPLEALQLIGSVRTTGPVIMVIDTQAQQPVDLVLSSAGQSQNLPVNVVLGVDDGEWCMLGLSTRQ